jgi:hypothetical protein
MFKIKHSQSKNYVSASDVGQYEFCPEAFRLAELNTKVNRANQKRMNSGTLQHEVWANSITPLILACIMLALALYLLWDKGLLTW